MEWKKTLITALFAFMASAAGALIAFGAIRNQVDINAKTVTRLAEVTLPAVEYRMDACESKILELQALNGTQEKQFNSVMRELDQIQNQLERIQNRIESSTIKSNR